jgi:serine/threonine protein kinase
MSHFEPAQRRAIELRLENCTLDEIAATLERSERTIRRWLAQAGELLSERWRDQLASADRKHPAITHDPAMPLAHADYHLHQLIGSGGMSKVYVATHRPTGRRVAVKVLRKRLRDRPHLVELFLREAQIVARFSHPNIVPVHGLGRLPDGGYFLVMDFIDGCDLAQLARRETITSQRAASIVATVADAIAHAHEHGVIHRDLKPGNVLIDQTGKIFVTDFGFAQLHTGESTSHAIVGTVGFMAPEQVDPTLGPIGPHTDVYGLGALLRVLLAENAPQELGAICEKCLADDWQHRYATARQVADALREWLASQPADCQEIRPPTRQSP